MARGRFSWHGHLPTMAHPPGSQNTPRAVSAGINVPLEVWPLEVFNSLEVVAFHGAFMLSLIA